MPEQISRTSRQTRKEQTPEKKHDSSPVSQYAPECAAAAAAEVGKVLGAGLDAQAGGRLLAGGNQMLISMLGRQREPESGTSLELSFSEGSPENQFQPGMSGDVPGIPEQTGQLPGVTDLAFIM